MGEIVYTCKKCGCHEFDVVHQFTEGRVYTQSVECDCEQSEDGIAMERQFETLTLHEIRYELQDDHRIGPAVDDQEEIDSSQEDPSQEEEIEYQVHCPDCLEAAQETDIETEEDLDKNEQLDDAFWVRCRNCDREIEFGWSHPDRGGRVWTCEDVDFNPWKSWPEPRYRKSWLEKDWIRPDRREIYERALEEEG